jgi:tetratricopeptide (TPR) repeat protein
VARVLFLGLLLTFGLPAQPPPQQAPPASPPAVQEQEPPEEDPDLKPKEYSFNPLEASRNITAGNFYFKKANYRAAARRYLEATKWDPNSPEGFLKLGESYEKLRDFNNARETYDKYLTIASDAKDIDAVKKKLAHLPKARGKK